MPEGYLSWAIEEDDAEVREAYLSGIHPSLVDNELGLNGPLSPQFYGRDLRATSGADDDDQDDGEFLETLRVVCSVGEDVVAFRHDGGLWSCSEDEDINAAGVQPVPEGEWGGDCDTLQGDLHDVARPSTSPESLTSAASLDLPGSTTSPASPPSPTSHCFLASSTQPALPVASPSPPASSLPQQASATTIVTTFSTPATLVPVQLSSPIYMLVVPNVITTVLPTALDSCIELENAATVECPLTPVSILDSSECDGVMPSLPTRPGDAWDTMRELVPSPPRRPQVARRRRQTPLLRRGPPQRSYDGGAIIKRRAAANAQSKVAASPKKTPSPDADRRTPQDPTLEELSVQPSQSLAGRSVVESFPRPADGRSGSTPLPETASGHRIRRPSLPLSPPASPKRYSRTGWCPICEGYFKRLDKHMMIHTQVRPHTCLVCRQGFTQSEHLKRHQQKHVETMDPQRRCPCPVCGRVLSRRDKLKNHLKKAHGPQERAASPASSSALDSLAASVTLLSAELETPVTPVQA